VKFTEAQLEAAIIELLGVEGYPHVLGEAIERQPQDVLIKADLRAFLAKQYAADHITPQEIEAVIKQLEAYSAADLYESNKAIMKLVSDGRVSHPFTEAKLDATGAVRHGFLSGIHIGFHHGS
jgi:type I restriction enzyme R subunit